MMSPRPRVFLLAVLSLLACAHQPQLEAAEAASVGVDEERPLRWGGLDVEIAGAPLAEARRVLVLFHGFGASAADLVPLSELVEAGEHAAFVFPEGPHRLEAGGRCWRRRDRTGFPESRAAALALLQDLRVNCPTCTVVVGGFSQGGMLAASLLTEGRDSLEAALLFSPSPESEPRPLRSEPPRVLLAHGLDDQVIPISWSKKLRRRLEAAGGTVDWLTFDGGHAIPGEALAAANRLLAELDAPPAR